MNPGDTFSGTAARRDRDGRGVVVRDGRAVHVADLLPGESGRITIEHVSPNRPDAWARLDERDGDPVPERVLPACAAFGRCGGCVWQHLAYPAQLDEKRRIVAEALGDRAEVLEVVPSPRESGYRNYGKYVVGTGAGGRLVLGAYAPRSHRVVSTLACRTVEPVIDEVATAAASLLADAPLTVYDEGTRTGELRYVLIRSSHDGRALVGLVTTSRASRRALERVARALRRAVPAVAGVVWVVNDATSGALVGPEHERLAGRDTLTDRLGPLQLEVGIGAFFQINRGQAERMYAAVADLAEGARAVDVYCGVGGIALTMASRGAHVIGIERHSGSIEAARAAATRNGLTDRAAFRVGTADTLADVARDAGAVVVNPPRKGLDAATRAALVRVRPRQILYVSCNPTSLARDLDDLTAAGYRVERTQPFDLMPGNSQIETVVSLRNLE